MARNLKRKCIEIGVGMLFYIFAIGIKRYRNVSEQIHIILYLLPYMVMCVSICWDFMKNMKNRRFFDENILIILATLGAFLIGKHSEAVATILFFQVGKLVEFISLERTKKSIAKFMDIRPEYANRKIRGIEEQVDPKSLEPRQIIVIKPGEKIPVDAVVTFGNSTVDTKALTGESEPSEVKIGNRLYSGSINISGVLEARVSKAYSESTASRILELVQSANNSKAKSERLADRFHRFYTPIVTMLGILVIILPPLMISGETKQEWLYRGLIFLVAACPCGLLVSVPLAFLGGIGAASKQGVLIKGSHFLEALSQTETFIFDKTGTLTEGVFQVKKICPKVLSEKELLEITAHGEVYSNHPIAVSLREAYGMQIDRRRVESVTEHSGFGVCAFIDGKEVLIGNSRFMNEKGYFYEPVREIGTAVHVAINGVYEGYILIADGIRDDVKKTIRWMKRHQLGTIMLTGDNERVAKTVARQIGIEEIYANLLPEDKVEQLQEFMTSKLEAEKFAFVGDGINDAPVLAMADIGIAMGGLGADAALEAADVILLRDEPSKIVNAIRISKGTLRAVKQNFIFAIGIKIILLTFAMLGYVTMQNAIIADMVVMLMNLLNSFWVLKYPE